MQLFGLPGMALALLARNDPRAVHRHLLQIGGLLLTLSTLISGVTAPLLLVLLLLSPASVLPACRAGWRGGRSRPGDPALLYHPGIDGRSRTPLHINELLLLLHPQFLLLGLVTPAVYYLPAGCCCNSGRSTAISGRNRHRVQNRSHTDLSLLAVGYLKGGIGNLRNSDSLTYMTVEVESLELTDEQALIRPRRVDPFCTGRLPVAVAGRPGG